MRHGRSGAAAAPLLDACCVLNLYATRRAAEIMRSMPERCEVTSRVMSEAIYVQRGGTGDDAGEKDRVDLQPAVDEGLVEVLHLDGAAEDASFIDFADVLGVGEAETLAIALHRRRAIATDDRKAIRLAREREISVVSTLEIIRRWADAGGLMDPICFRF